MPSTWCRRGSSLSPAPSCAASPSWPSCALSRTPFSPPITVATRAVFAFGAALTLAELLRRVATHAGRDEPGAASAETEVGGGPVRIVGWAAVAAVIASVLSGYVALASFLVDQVMWISVLLALLLLGVSLADEFIGETLRGQTRIASALQANTGLRRKSLE